MNELLISIISPLIALVACSFTQDIKGIDINSPRGIAITLPIAFLGIFISVVIIVSINNYVY